jgi:hypothetical protein
MLRFEVRLNDVEKVRCRLRKLWQEAVADDSEAIAETVFKRMESKLEKLAKAKAR